MAEYIDKEAACNALNSEGYTKNMRVHKKILAIPAADVVEVRHGRWIEQPLDFDLCGVAYYQCSECRKEQQTSSNYCQFCGAKMDGGQSDA